MKSTLLSLLAWLISFTIPLALADDFEFALLGDNPYSDGTYDNYLRLIDHVNQQPDIQWVVHLGDVKGGTASCSDEQIERYFALNQRFQPPFLLTPGDNDWLDCKRRGAGGFNEYERLDAFRRVFFPTPGYSTGVNPMAISQQSESSDFPEFVENARWDHQGVVFATVHVVALTEAPTDRQQYEHRTAAATAWIKAAFQRAQQIDASGVFLAMQADPWIVFGLPALVNQSCETCTQPRSSLEWLYPLLIDQSLAFAKPVVLAVGDTHIFRVDKPLYTDSRQLVENFTRVEGFGNPLVHWINVLVEPDKPWVFSFRQQLVK